MARFGILRAWESWRAQGTSSSKIAFDFTPLHDALNAIGEAGAEVVTETAPAIAEILVAHVQDVFEREGDVAGRGRWPELAESTKKQRRGTSFIILQDSGILAGSITPYAEGAEAEAFTNVPYAGFQVSTRPRRHLPKRDFTAIDFDSAQRETADLLLAQFSANAGRAA